MPLDIDDGGNLKLYANASCPVCRGRGEVREAHGETLDCECAFEDASCDLLGLHLIEIGKFSVHPAPEWIKEMEAWDRQTPEH